MLTLFQSTAVVDNSSIYDCNMFDTIFLAMDSTLNISNVHFKDLTKDINGVPRTIRLAFNSFAMVSNITFENIEFPLLTVIDSVMEVYDSYMNNITSPDLVYECITSKDIVLNNITMVNSKSVNLPELISFKK